MLPLFCLFEVEKKNDTKLSIAEKVAGGFGIAGGTGLYALTKKLQYDDERGPISSGQKFLPPEIYREYQDDVNNIKNIGLGAAATTAGILAAHKLYKMYKNKKSR
jgi:hypothetical protein